MPSLEQWQTLLLRLAHRFRDEPTNPLQFASSALGHDLRTPMTVVIGASELLLEGALDPEQRIAAENVHRSGQQLLGVIDQMLSDVTEQGKSTPPPRALTALESDQRLEPSQAKFIACCSRKTTNSIAY